MQFEKSRRTKKGFTVVLSRLRLYGLIISAVVLGFLLNAAIVANERCQVSAPEGEANSCLIEQMSSVRSIFINLGGIV